jgi:excisionase family DNA binding protein
VSEAIPNNEIRVLEQEEQPFYTIKSLARRLSCSDRTAKRMVDEGEIPSYYFRGMRRIDKSDIDSYLAEHRDDRRNAA